MLWVKTFHILFVMSWMAGIFYLPRIFVHFVEGQQADQQVDPLAIMARNLYGFMTIVMVLAVGSGLWLWLSACKISLRYLFTGVPLLDSSDNERNA